MDVFMYDWVEDASNRLADVASVDCVILLETQVKWSRGQTYIFPLLFLRYLPRAVTNPLSGHFPVFPYSFIVIFKRQ